mmetsp:Transcript_76934/g.152328  ORF Transcript_76934/g.152328 Transcript_76934/m.152328 type:complete len:221 (+) Transcript_76934:103-765(+)
MTGIGETYASSGAVARRQRQPAASSNAVLSEECTTAASAAVHAMSGGHHGGLLQELVAENLPATASTDKSDDDEPPLGVVLKLAEVSGCDLDSCCAALVACDNDFHAALAQLRSNANADETGAKARAQMRAALQMLEEARAGRSVARGALGSAWIAAALLLHAFELVMPERFLEILLALLGLRADGPLGLFALLLPPLTAVLALIVLLRDVDSFLNPEPG